MIFLAYKNKTRHVGGFAVGKLKIQSTKHARHFRKVVVVVVVVVFSLSMA